MKLDSLHVAIFQKPRPSPKLFSDSNNLPFASVMAMVMVVVLFTFMIYIGPFHHGISTDLPRVLDPVAMPGADSADAIVITILRDSQVYFRSERIRDLSGLPTEIKTYLKDPHIEHKAYIKADARARWGEVKEVLEAVHDAGIMRVGFLAEQHKFH